MTWPKWLRSKLPTWYGRWTKWKIHWANENSSNSAVTKNRLIWLPNLQSKTHYFTQTIQIQITHWLSALRNTVTLSPWRNHPRTLHISIARRTRGRTFTLKETRVWKFTKGNRISPNQTSRQRQHMHRPIKISIRRWNDINVKIHFWRNERRVIFQSV